MARPDDMLRRIAQERLHAVARPGPPAPHRAAREPVRARDAGTAWGAHAAWDADAPHDVDAEPHADGGFHPRAAWVPTGVRTTDAAVRADASQDPALHVAAPPAARRAVGDRPHLTVPHDHPAPPVRGRHRDVSAPPDVGRADVGSADAGPPDAGHPGVDPADLGSADAGPPDAGHPDVGPAHVGPPDDVRDVVERMRREALAEAAAGYSARHGHPLDHPSMDGPPPAWRWFLTVRHAVVAGSAVALLTAGVVLRATADVPPTTEPPGEAVSVSSAVGPVGTADLAPPAGAAATPAQGQTASSAGTAGAPRAAPTDDGATGPPATPDPSTTVVVVHVVGQVQSPGVVRLPAGSRVADALHSAGGAGPAADLAGVNLARVLVDGEQIVVPAPGETVVAAPSGGGPASTPADGPAVVDLNTADLADLDGLPGIGPVLAQRIVDWRAENGPFRDVEELGEVTGIGDALLGRLRALVGV